MSVRDEVRALIASGVHEPRDIAARIAESVTDPHAALVEALPSYVRDVIVSARQAGRVATPGPANPVGSGRSRKVAAIRDGWQRRLDELYSINGAYKPLRACTYDDLMVMAGELDRQAQAKMSRARGWRALAAALTDHDVATVGALPVETLHDSLGAAA